MNLRKNVFRAGVACVLAATLVGPLAAQTANNPGTNNPNGTTGVQGANDVVPLLVLLTGPLNWALVGSATGFGNTTTGGGGGGGPQWIVVAEATAVPQIGPQAREPVASVTTADGRTLKDVKVLKLLPPVGDGLILGDRVALIHAEGSETVALDSLGDEARKRLGLVMPVKPGYDPATPAAKGSGERDAKFWADLELLVPDWRTLDANQERLDWLMRKDLGNTLHRHERARALAIWLAKQWEPWEARNVDPANGRPRSRAEPLPLPPY